MLTLMACIAYLAAEAASVLVVSCTDSLTEIDTETGTVTHNVASPGESPNDILWFQDHFFVVNSLSDDVTLQKFDPEGWTVQSLGIGPGLNCWAALPVGGDTLAISCAAGNSIALVDASEMSLLGFVEGVGPNPEWFCVAEGRLYAACGGWLHDNKVVVVDLATLQPCDTIQVGFNCQGCTYDGEDEVYAICTGTYSAWDGEVHVIEVETGTVTGVISAGFAPAFGVCRGDSLYVSDLYGNGIMLIDTETGTMVDPSLMPGGSGLAVDDQGNLWVADSGADRVSCYDHDHRLVSEYTVPMPFALGVSSSLHGIGQPPAPPGTLSLYPSPASATVRIVPGGAASGVPTLFDLSGRELCRAVPAGEESWTLDVSNVPMGVYVVVSGNCSSRLAVVR